MNRGAQQDTDWLTGVPISFEDCRWREGWIDHKKVKAGAGDEIAIRATGTHTAGTTTSKVHYNYTVTDCIAWNTYVTCNDRYDLDERKQENAEMTSKLTLQVKWHI